MEKAIGEFEKQELFAPFSSKYDRALKGEAELTALEAEGKALFFDKTRTNCSNCHQSSEANSAKKPLRITAITISAYQVIKN